MFYIINVMVILYSFHMFPLMAYFPGSMLIGWRVMGDYDDDDDDEDDSDEDDSDEGEYHDSLT